MSKSIFRSSLIVSASIFTSRIFGLIRDIVIASIFGASGLTDAFFVAFRIPNLLRRIFAEGAFSSAFTPTFSKLLKASKEEALKIAGEFFSVLLISLTLVLVVGELFAPQIVKLIAPGLKEKNYLEAVKLLREMFPYIFTVSFVAFFGGILNGFDHFFAPAFSTVLFNVAIITSGLLLHDKLSVEGLAVGVVAGGILQLILQLIFIKKLKAFPKPSLSLSTETKRILKNIIPGIFGFAVRQISMLIDTVIASFLKSGTISYLYYANRFVQLPLGMFAIGLSQVLLPKLAKRRGEKDFKEHLSAGLTYCSSIVIPASLGLIFFGKPIIDLIFNHGAFTVKDLEETYKVLVGYSIGLFFFSVEKIVTNSFYSVEEFKTPVKISAFTLIFNLITNLLLCFTFNLGALGLALGTSLTSMLNVFILLEKFKAYWNWKEEGLWKVALKYLGFSFQVVLIALIGERIYFMKNSPLWHVAVTIFTITSAAIFYLSTLFIVKDKVIQLIKEEK